MSLTQPTDEVDRVVVRLPDDASFFGGPTFIPIAVDKTGASSTPALLESDAGIGYLAEYQLLDRLCSDRAQRTVDGTLLANGKRVTPEQYLRLWRKAIAAAITPAQLHAQRGWTLMVQFRGPLNDPSLDVGTSSWTLCPFKTYGAFRRKYTPVMKRLSEGLDEVTLDLREADSARDAHFAESLMTSVIGYRGSWSSALLLATGQPSLEPGSKATPYLSEAA